jgi:hypothetical protein
MSNMVMDTAPTRSGETEVVVIVKAAPQVGQRRGETVCCAGIDLYGNRLRLYPVAFRTLDDGQKFRRWDRIRFKWRMPTDDGRAESRRVDQDSIAIEGELKRSEREAFLARSIVTGINKEMEAGRSLALLKPRVIDFRAEKKKQAEVDAEIKAFAVLHAQSDLFNTKAIIPYQPCPYSFKYRYETDDGKRDGTCQDWEMEATFFNWRKRYSEEQALAEMWRVFGEEYPAKGMLFAMGTHSLYPETWLINGVVRLDEVKQGTLF